MQFVVCRRVSVLSETEIIPSFVGCEIVVKSRLRLKEHLRSHSQEKLMSCPTCGSLFSNATKFFDHVQRQTTGKSL